MKVLTNRTISSFIGKLSDKSFSSQEAIFRIDTALSFITWLSSTAALSESDSIRFRNELFKAKHEYTRPKALGSSYPLKYVGFSLAVISFLLIGAGIYLRFYKNVKTPLAYSTAPVRPGRIISFQGRLTDTLGNPIVTPIDITYNFYTAPAGGTPITLSTRVCTASPDQDGVFNSLIGNDTGPSCNTELPSTIFTENTNVYLGVKIAAETTEMTPRQQIANVGYAINSETLQGIPPGQGVSNIPFINQGGNMLIAASNPGIRSTYASTNFTISSAQAATIQSAGSGDITLSATEGGSLRFKVYNGSLAEQMTILNTGNVGIGNTSPVYKLDVAGGVGIVGQFSGRVIGANAVNSNEFATLGQITLGAGQPWQRTLGSVVPTNITDDINVGGMATGSALVHLPGLTNKNAFFNLGTGNMGIGTTGPTNKLYIYTTTNGDGLAVDGSTSPGISLNGAGTNRGFIGIPTAANNWVVGSAVGDVVYRTGGGTMLFTTDGGSNALFTLKGSNGNVGIGTTAPMAKLDVNGTASISGALTLYGTPTIASIALRTLNLGGTTTGNIQLSAGSTTPSFVVTTAGHVGIGTTSPSYKLTVNGEPGANGYTAFTNYSDSRLKTNINSLGTGYLDKILALKPSTFNYNALTGYDQNTLDRTITGFIAQDLQTVFPEMVGKTTINGTEYLDTNLSALPVYTIKALQEQQTQITSLSADTGTTLAGIVAKIEALIPTKKIVSPVIEIDEIKPVNGDLTINLNSVGADPSVRPMVDPNKGQLAKLIIKGLNNTPVVSIDSSGNATFAGTLTANTASITGTLIAKNVQSENINTIQSNVASISSTLASNTSQFASDINTIQQQLATLKNQPLPNPAYYQNIDASYNNLTVNDTANLYKAHIADSLVVGTLFIQPTSILALSSDLRIASLGTIRLFDDAVVIAKNGDMAIKGAVSASSLAIKNTDGVTVASIDASGSARFNEVIAKKFTLDTIATQGALIANSGIMNETNTPIPAIKTKAEVAGTGELPQDTKELIIYNDNVTQNSLIYLTPTSSNMQGQLSVTKKSTCTGRDHPTPTLCSPYFVISSNVGIHSASSFNWLIIN